MMKNNGKLPADKNELIKKLKEINEAYREKQRIKARMDDPQVEDTYERKCKALKKPEKPDNMTEPIKPHITPMKPVSKEEFSKSEFKETVKYIKSHILKGVLCIVLLLLSTVFLGMMYSAYNVVLAILHVIGFAVLTFLYVKPLIPCVKADIADNNRRKTDEAYRAYVAELEEKERKRIEEAENKYAEEMRVYSAYKIEYDKYLKELDKYNKSLDEVDKEEKEIKQKIEEEKKKKAESIKQKEYIPASEELERLNDVISDDDLPDLGKLISLLEKGRADTLKEAFSVLEDMKYREEQRRLAEERERQAEERRLEELEYREREREREREEMQRERDRDEARRREMDEKREREEQERKWEEEKKKKQELEDARQQCYTCTVQNCWNRNKYTNCPNYKPKKGLFG